MNCKDNKACRYLSVEDSVIIIGSFETYAFESIVKDSVPGEPSLFETVNGLIETSDKCGGIGFVKTGW